MVHVQDTIGFISCLAVLAVTSSRPAGGTACVTDPGHLKPSPGEGHRRFMAWISSKMNFLKTCTLKYKHQQPVNSPQKRFRLLPHGLKKSECSLSGWAKIPQSFISDEVILASRRLKCTSFPFWAPVMNVPAGGLRIIQHLRFVNNTDEWNPDVEPIFLPLFLYGWRHGTIPVVAFNFLPEITTIIIGSLRMVDVLGMTARHLHLERQFWCNLALRCWNSLTMTCVGIAHFGLSV
jgi:hypothetical protein